MARTERSAKVTTDPDQIRRWVESRGGRPAVVRDAGGEGPGILRIDFPGDGSDPDLEPISCGAGRGRAARGGRLPAA